MLQHFRETVNHLFFYSLPVELVRKLPMKQLAVALTSMLSVKGKAAQPSGTLPLGPEHQSLPLQDRVQALPDFHQDSSSFLGPLEDESPGNHGESQPADTKLDLEQLILHCQCDGLLVFKVADKNPHLKKRPLHSVDNLLPTEVAIRLYRAEKINDTDIHVYPTASSEVPLLQLFTGDPQQVIDHLQSWKLDVGICVEGMWKGVPATCGVPPHTCICGSEAEFKAHCIRIVFGTTIKRMGMENLGWKTCRFEETPHPTWSVAGEQSVLRWRVPLLLVFGGASLNRKGCEEHQFLDAWTVGDLLPDRLYTGPASTTGRTAEVASEPTSTVLQDLEQVGLGFIPQWESGGLNEFNHLRSVKASKNTCDYTITYNIDLIF